MQKAKIETQSLARPPGEPRWKALVSLQSSGGAIIIRAVDGGFVGWATDTAGDTDFSGGYHSATPVAEIRRNAAKMSLAPMMLDVCRLLVHGSQRPAAEAMPATAEALDLAAEVLAEMERLA